MHSSTRGSREKPRNVRSAKWRPAADVYFSAVAHSNTPHNTDAERIHALIRKRLQKAKPPIVEYTRGKKNFSAGRLTWLPEAPERAAPACL